MRLTNRLPLCILRAGGGALFPAVRSMLLALAIACCMLPVKALAGTNKGLALGWKGYADTDLHFSEFFDADHTISFRFMPQYPNAYEGPIIAENGSGTFVLGLADFRAGAVWGPKLYLKIGTGSALFIPAYWLEPGNWYDVAVVAHGFTSGFLKYQTFTLYLNGVKLGSYDFPQFDPLRPSGTLRFGKRTTGQTVNERDAQFYGLVDEVAVFTNALSDSEVKSLTANMQLTGSETSLLAAYNFDGGSQPAKLARPIKLSSESAQLIPVLHTVADLAAMPLPSTQHVNSTLPFKAGEPWYVIQGYADGLGSHNGYAAFCWDFDLANQPQQGVYPFGTQYAPFYAAAPGKVTLVKQDSVSGKQNPSNGIVIQQEPDVLAMYLHLWTNTAQVAVDETVPRGKQLAQAGDTGTGIGAYHLHTGVRNVDPPGDITFPVVFTNYERLFSDGTWHRVLRGIPRDGDVVRRPFNPNARYNAIWRPSQARGFPEEYRLEGISLQDFETAYLQIFPEGWRIHQLQAYVQNGVVLYNAVWRPGTTAETQLYGKTYADYKAKYDELWPKGWRLFHLQSYVLNGEVLYDAVWRPGSSSEIQVYGFKDQDFKTKYTSMWMQGWRLVILQSYVSNGEVLWNAVWRPGNTGEAPVFGKTYQAFKTQYDLALSQGLRLSILQSYVMNGEVRYNAVWTPGISLEAQSFEVSYADFVKQYDEMHAKGWRLELLDAYPQ